MQLMAGERVILEGGEVGILTTDETAVMDSAGECPECCGLNPLVSDACVICGTRFREYDIEFSIPPLVTARSISSDPPGTPPTENAFSLPLDGTFKLTTCKDYVSGNQPVYSAQFGEMTENVCQTWGYSQYRLKYKNTGDDTIYTVDLVGEPYLANIFTPLPTGHEWFMLSRFIILFRLFNSTVLSQRHQFLVDWSATIRFGTSTPTVYNSEAQWISSSDIGAGPYPSDCSTYDSVTLPFNSIFHSTTSPGGSYLLNNGANWATQTSDVEITT